MPLRLVKILKPMVMIFVDFIDRFINVKVLVVGVLKKEKVLVVAFSGHYENFVKIR